MIFLLLASVVSLLRGLACPGFLGFLGFLGRLGPPLRCLGLLRCLGSLRSHGLLRCLGLLRCPGWFPSLGCPCIVWITIILIVCAKRRDSRACQWHSRTWSGPSSDNSSYNGPACSDDTLRGVVLHEVLVFPLLLRSLWFLLHLLILLLHLLYQIFRTWSLPVSTSRPRQKPLQVYPTP